MNFAPTIVLAAGFFNPWFLPVAVLSFPIALTFLFFPYARLSANTERTRVWFRYRQLNPLITAATLAAWWSVWDSRPFEFLQTPHGGLWTFWVPPVGVIGINLFVCYATNRRLLKFRWSFADLIRLAWWKTVSFSLPILMIALACDDILKRETARGIAWMAVAGFTNVIGTGFLRMAEGMKLHRAKSGELRSRALAVARRMGVTFARFYIIPEGKGHLANACGGSLGVAVTDNLGKLLSKPQIDCVLAHELAHVTHKHGLKQRLWAVAIFSALTALLTLSRPRISSFADLAHFIIVLGPLLILYFISRHFEYVADGEADDVTGDAEDVIRALANLSLSSGVSSDYDSFTELFQTHPSLSHRARAIAIRRGMSPDHVREILGAVSCR